MRLSVLILLILGWFVTLTPHGSAGQGAVVGLSADVDELELHKSPTDDDPAHVLGAGDEAGRDPVDGRVKLELLEVHPKESGDFQLDDMWICEKMQRALHSPRYGVGALARGAGAEAPLTYFQQQVLDALER